VRKSVPDIMLIDIGLPGMNGYEVARHVRESLDGNSILLIALTGYGRDDDQQRAREAGFDRHLVKPIDLAHLENVLSELAKPRPTPAKGTNTIH
jgi:CheY-like chemotaxis protein